MHKRELSKEIQAEKQVFLRILSTSNLQTTQDQMLDTIPNSNNYSERFSQPINTQKPKSQVKFRIDLIKEVERSSKGIPQKRSGKEFNTISGPPDNKSHLKSRAVAQTTFEDEAHSAALSPKIYELKESNQQHTNVQLPTIKKNTKGELPTENYIQALAEHRAQNQLQIKQQKSQNENPVKYSKLAIVTEEEQKVKDEIEMSLVGQLNPVLFSPHQQRHHHKILQTYWSPHQKF